MSLPAFFAGNTAVCDFFCSGVAICADSGSIVSMTQQRAAGRKRQKGRPMTSIKHAIYSSQHHSTIVEATAENAKEALAQINESWAHEWDYQINDDSVDAWGWTDDDNADAMTWRIKVILEPAEVTK